MAMPMQPALFPDVEGPEFLRADDVEAVADDVLDRHGRVGGVGRLFDTRSALLDGEVHVLYLLNTKPFDPLKDDVRHDAIAKCVKAPRLWHDITGYDVAIWVRSYFWDQFDPRQRSALLLHELLHVEIERDEKTNEPKVKVRPHDLEEFTSVVRHYGDWMPDVRGMVAAHGLWSQDGGEPAPDSTAPTPIRKG